MCFFHGNKCKISRNNIEKSKVNRKKRSYAVFAEEKKEITIELLFNEFINGKLNMKIISKKGSTIEVADFTYVL